MLYKIFTLWFFVVFGFYHASYAGIKITKIEFLGSIDPHEILIQADGPISFDKQENEKDKQIVLEIKNAKLANKNVAMKLDTSSFDSKVSLISPYQVSGQDTVRVIVQLREMVKTEANTEGNLLKLKVNGGAVAAAIDSPPAIVPPETKPETKPEIKVESKADVKPESKPDRLTEFMENRETKRFVGRSITLRVRDADVLDVFRLISEASGFNIILGDDVKGKITLSLVDVPWDLALDTVLHTLRLGAERNNNILRVVTLLNLATEKQEQLRAKKATEATAPLVTRVFPVSYASLKDLQDLLSKFGTTGGDGATSSIVQVDNRTNSIIVRDIADNVDKIKKLIEILDTQTPQVMIEAKIVEATEGFSKEIGGKLGLGTKSKDTQFFASILQANPIDALFGAPGVFSDGSDLSGKVAEDSATFGFSPKLTSILPGVDKLNALLTLGEKENEINVVASPKTVVLNKEKDSIVQGTPVLVPGSTVVPGVGTVSTTSVQQAKLKLDVKPTVTNDGNILLELEISRDIPFALDSKNFGIAERNLKSTVVVESGSTLVIGGIYTLDTKHKSSGFPFLRKIPIIGWFFGSESDDTVRTELFIFITPRIINEREAGLSG